MTRWALAWLGLVAWASVPATAAADAPAGVLLPEVIRDKLLDICWRPPAQEADYLRGRRIVAVDLDGDHRPEYVIQTWAQSEPGAPPACGNEVLGRRRRRAEELFRFQCCDFETTAAASRRAGGSIRCKDNQQTLFAWKGAWPAFERAPGRAQAAARRAEARALFAARQLDQARQLACAPSPSRCEVDSELGNLCAKTEMLAGDLDQAWQTLAKVGKADPSFPDQYLTRGAVAQKAGQLGQAIEQYEEYLKRAPPSAPDYARVQRQLNVLRAQQDIGE